MNQPLKSLHFILGQSETSTEFRPLFFLIASVIPIANQSSNYLR